MPNCPQCQADLPLQGDKCPKCGADINWWSSRNGQVYGPYDLATVHFCRQDGRIVDTDYVRVGEGAWGWARDVLPTHAAYAPKPLPSQLAPIAPAPQVKPAKSGRSPYLVVAVVAGVGLLLLPPIMAAILFPVFARAREKARAASCQSNLKQLGLVLAMYAEDNAGRLPPGTDWGAACSLQLKSRPLGSDLWACPATEPPRKYLVTPDYLGKPLLVPAGRPPTAPMLQCPSLPSGGEPHNGGRFELFPNGQVAYEGGAGRSNGH